MILDSEEEREEHIEKEVLRKWLWESKRNMLDSLRKSLGQAEIK